MTTGFLAAVALALPGTAIVLVPGGKGTDGSSGTAQLAQVNFQPLPASVVMPPQAQIAKIR
jgi:hypothetical protein